MSIICVRDNENHRCKKNKKKTNNKTTTTKTEKNKGIKAIVKG